MPLGALKGSPIVRPNAVGHVQGLAVLVLADETMHPARRAVAGDALSHACELSTLVFGHPPRGEKAQHLVAQRHLKAHFAADQRLVGQVIVTPQSLTRAL